MSSSLITHSLRLLRISSQVKWQAPAVAAVRHYGKYAAVSTVARRDFITGINTHTHTHTCIDTRVFYSQSAQTFLQTNQRAEHGCRVWGYVGPSKAKDTQRYAVHSEERTAGDSRGCWIRQSKGAHRTLPHAHLGALLHSHWQPQQVDQDRHSQLSAKFRGHGHGALSVWCE